MDIGSLPEEALHTTVESDVELLGCESVVIVNPSPGVDFLLSVSLEDAGMPRVFVGASTSNEYRCQACSSFSCQHCLHVQSWVEARETEEEEIGEIWDSFGMRKEGQIRQQPRTPPRLPISSTRLPPNYSSFTVAGRAVCLGKLSACTARTPFSEVSLCKGGQ